MSKVDLTLVPIEDLIQEIKSRTENFVIGYTRKVDEGEPILLINHTGESFLTCYGLCFEIQQSIYKASRQHIEPENSL